ncbi:hypothetical protein ACLB2K_014037 [Fragaria x ananassa]
MKVVAEVQECPFAVAIDKCPCWSVQLRCPCKISVPPSLFSLYPFPRFWFALSASSSASWFWADLIRSTREH